MLGSTSAVWSGDHCDGKLRTLRIWLLIGVLCPNIHAGSRAVSLTFDDLPPQFAAEFNRAAFPEFIQNIERETAAREHEGELDHLIAYALQSRHFTNQPAIEPARSAKEVVESGTVPPGVSRRLTQFLKALAKPRDNTRLSYFAGLLTPDEHNLPYLLEQYERVSRFLYAKEFRGAKHAYETRGHSTDTQVAANFAVWNALNVIKASAPAAKIRKILVVGPGLDFAPRTELMDAFAPQSFQPFAIADAVLRLRMAQARNLEIDCVDINERVVHYINSFPTGGRLLHLYSEPGVADYNAYFASLGNAIGKSVDINGRKHVPTGFLERTVAVDGDVARSVHAFPLNILTERLAEQYDLVIATNVLLYFDEHELPLVLTNIAHMVSEGGYFVHNDLRPIVEAEGGILEMPPIAARTVLVAQGRLTPLYDAFSICQKRQTPKK
jgi:hypothetical protein